MPSVSVGTRTHYSANAQQLERAHFLELFPHIKAAKERGVPTKQTLAMSASNGLKLSAATFGIRLSLPHFPIS